LAAGDKVGSKGGRGDDDIDDDEEDDTLVTTKTTTRTTTMKSTFQFHVAAIIATCRLTRHPLHLSSFADTSIPFTSARNIPKPLALSKPFTLILSRYITKSKALPHPSSKHHYPISQTATTSSRLLLGDSSLFPGLFCDDLQPCLAFRQPCHQLLLVASNRVELIESADDLGQFLFDAVRHAVG